MQIVTPGKLDRHTPSKLGRATPGKLGRVTPGKLSKNRLTPIKLGKLCRN